MAISALSNTDIRELSENELVQSAKNGNADAFRIIMQRSNQRLFRVARSVVRDDAEAEDVIQEAYLRAFSHLSSFRGASTIQTWLTRITLNVAKGRLRKRHPNIPYEQLEAIQSSGDRVIMFPNGDHFRTPENELSRIQVRNLLESAVNSLPEDFRLVFILRDVEGCSTADTAETLSIAEATVKTRLYRARRLLREALSEHLVTSVRDAFPFLGQRCERLTTNVLARLSTMGKTFD